jgi:hypothetical protein
LSVRERRLMSVTRDPPKEEPSSQAQERRAVRVAGWLSQATLGARCGVGPWMIGKWETTTEELPDTPEARRYLRELEKLRRRMRTGDLVPRGEDRPGR